MDLEARVALVKQVGEEIVTEEELRALLAAKAHPVAYDGFEPSGTAHIAQGVMRAINVNKMTRAGFRFKMFVADWHAWANNKMGGDLERIQVTGKYLIEIWRATGMDLSKVDFVWASEFIEDEAYWKKVMNIARDTSLDRVLRTTQIMGRSEKDKLSAAQILYPCMQAADIFHLQADVTQLGMDQRKVNMLAREVGPKLGFWKPVVISHHMLMGLQAPPPPVSAGMSDIGRILSEELEPIMSIATGDMRTWLQQGVHLGLSQKADDKIEWQVLFSFLAHMDDSVQVRIERHLSLLTEATDLIVTDETTGSVELQVARQTLFEELAVYLRTQQAFRMALRRIQELHQRFRSQFEDRATAMKMSKSKPDSAIFMTDTPEQVQGKLRKAYCPAKQAQDNPILEYYRYIIFERFPAVRIERPAKFGGDVEFGSYAELEKAFVEGTLGPVDAKAGVGKYINQLLDPVREHFEKEAAARELKAQVDSFKVTR